MTQCSKALAVLIVVFVDHTEASPALIVYYSTDMILRGLCRHRSWNQVVSFVRKN